MMDCKFVTKDMLNRPVIVQVEESPLTFSTARTIADRKARELSSDPMLLAWFDRQAGKFSPDVICCDRNKPTWLVYAEARGADISVDINNEDYVFVYRAAE
ncbi:MAG: AF1514 family protein [Desulfomonile tiedjei]|nr:AF1514 family protein [Desulfomonile tiedjei]